MWCLCMAVECILAIPFFVKVKEPSVVGLIEFVEPASPLGARGVQHCNQCLSKVVLFSGSSRCPCYHSYFLHIGFTLQYLSKSRAAANMSFVISSSDRSALDLFRGQAVYAW